MRLAERTRSIAGAVGLLSPVEVGVRSLQRARLREARVAMARKQQRWDEIVPAERLCPRGPARYGWLVDSETDLVWVRSRGVFFGNTGALADMVGVTFFVDAAGDVVVLEPAPVSTWSQVVKKRPDLVKATAA